MIYVFNKHNISFDLLRTYGFRIICGNYFIICSNSTSTLKKILQTHGRIIAENPQALLDLLRETSAATAPMNVDTGPIPSQVCVFHLQMCVQINTVSLKI